MSSPELSQKGAYTPQSVYTQKDVQNVVSYAAAVWSPFFFEAKLGWEH